VTQTAQAPPEAPTSAIPRRLVLVLAVACGVVVANLYYAQPLLSEIAHSLQVSAGTAGLLITLSQVGYAAGLLFVVPLGDLLERRHLVVGALAVAALALVGCALAPTLPVLAALLLVAGVTSVVAQVLVPFAATLAADDERGKVVGTVMTGLLLGILLARTASGLVGQWLGWRAVFAVAAGLMVVLIVVLRAELPVVAPTSTLRYGSALRSVGTLLRTHPTLRIRCVLGALGFAAFSVFWTTLAFLLAGAPYHYGDAVIGLFGLAGAAGALVAGRAGRLADRGLAHRSTLAFAALVAVAFLPTFFGAHHLLPLLVGVVVLDLGVQGLQITNQSEVYRLDAAARSRITTAYMTSYFLGGAAGSALGSALWSTAGWGGVCTAGGVLGVAALAVGSQTGRVARGVERRRLAASAA
jgi:predicted MFS family arabinose efflux permease